MPPTDVVRLLDMVVVNVLVCNTDAHAKNYSIMIRGNGASLAPIYDVMCGEVWENVTKNLAIPCVAQGITLLDLPPQAYEFPVPIWPLQLIWRGSLMPSVTIPNCNRRTPTDLVAAAAKWA